MTSEFSNTMRAMQGAITGARAMLSDALTVERIQRAAAGHIRSEDTVTAALREVDASLKVLQDAYQQAASEFATVHPIRPTRNDVNA